MENSDYSHSLKNLEEKHLQSQPFAWPHVKVHWDMLLLSYKYRDWKEFFGQIPRLILAAPGSVLGKAPAGNVGTTKMGIFEAKKTDL